MADTKSSDASDTSTDRALQEIARATTATADAVGRLLAVARFGPQAGAGGGGGSGGFPTGGPGSGLTSARAALERDQRQMQQRLLDRIDTISRLGGGSVAASAGRTAQFASGLGQAGFSGAAGLARGAAIPFAVAGAAASGAEKIAGYAYDKYSTNEQIGRQAVRDFVPGGARVQQFVDAMTGRAAGYEQADIDAKKRIAMGNNRNQVASFELGYNPQQAGREAYSAAYQKQAAVLPSVMDRSSAVGERAYREEQRMLPLKREQAKAEREYATATAERLSAQKELNKTTERARALENQRDGFLRELKQSGNQSGASRQDVLKKIETANIELGGVNSLRQRAATAEAEARAKEARASGEMDTARVRTMLGRADVLDERAQTAKGTARRLGGMNPLEQMQAVQAAALVAERGSTEGLPPEFVQLAQMGAEKTVGKVIEQTGMNSQAYQMGAANPLLAADFPTTDPNSLQKEADTLRRDAAQQEDEIAKRVAQQTATAFRGLGKAIGDALSSELNKALTDIMNAIRIAKNPM